MANNCKLRIISGQYRSRIIQFKAASTLRPTSDRLRETLFNWLGADIINAHCLDLFAGSGILGFESLSRGAAHCTFIEFNPLSTSQLHVNAEVLKLNDSQKKIITRNGIQYLGKCETQFDVIFLDPPYGTAYLIKSLRKIHQYKALKENGFVYAEHSTEQEIDLSPLPFDIIKKLKTGSTIAYLLKAKPADAAPENVVDTADSEK